MPLIIVHQVGWYNAPLALSNPALATRGLHLDLAFKTAPSPPRKYEIRSTFCRPLKAL